MILLKKFVIPDIIRFVIVIVGEDDQDAVGGKVVHFPPDEPVDQQPFVGAVQQMRFDFAAAVRKRFGHIDALINNAGVASMNHFMLTPLETARRLMNTNFFGPFAAIRAFISLLKKSEHPRVVNFSTVAVPFNLDGELAYVSSKAAVEELTKILAKELSGFKITVNAVGPTPVKTALTAKVPENKIQALLDRQAIKRFGEFEDIRNVINFYLQPESDFITGQIIYLGGVNK